MAWKIPARHLGSISLCIASGGLIILVLILHFRLVAGTAAQLLAILSTAFEAGTAGALADWFAVRALFQEIPIPLMKKHTNIIVKNRGRLTEGIVDMVQNQWLTATAVQDYLKENSLSGKIVRYIESPRGRMRTMMILRDTVVRFAETIDSKEMADFLQHTVKQQIITLDIGQPLGRWLQKRIHIGELNSVWEVLLDSFEKTIAAPDIEMQVRKLVMGLIKQYGDKSIGKRFGVWIGEKFHVIDYDEASRLILREAQLFINHARNNPANPIRIKFNAYIEDFANGLVTGNPDTTKFCDSIKANLVQNMDITAQIMKVLSQFKKDVIEEAGKEDAGLVAQLGKGILQLFSDSKNQAKIDLWLQKNLPDFIDSHKDDIGQIVRISLDPKKLSDESLIEGIEPKIHNELQYIRLNGAVVGGFAGLVFGIIRTLVT